jgi:zinc D-Ala-D-Ala carboxypeptidase
MEEARMQLTANFSLIELTSSETAVRKGIDNTPSIEVTSNLRELCANVLQPLRTQYAKPINITSGYRSPKLNKAIGGSASSDHCLGRAADFTVPNEDYQKVFGMLMTMNFDQLIWEFGNDKAPQWIHVSYRAQGNRKQVLRAVKEGGKTKYLPF